MHTADPGDVETQVRAAIGAEPLGPKDQGLVALAITYAGQIDQGGDLAKLGPALLACLESLLLSPRARAAAKKAVTDDKPSSNPLDELANRRAGKSRTETLDATAT